MKTAILYFFASLLLVSGVASAQGGFPATVIVARAELTTLAPQIRVSGTVISRDDARIAAEVGGRIVSITEIGARVKKDEVLAKIEDNLLREQEKENNGLVASQNTRIAFLQRELARLRKLAAQNNAARSQLDQTESDLAVARSDLQVAKARLAQIQIGLFKSEIRAPFDGRVTERFLNAGEQAAVGEDIVRMINPDRLEVVARAPLNAVSFLEEGAPLMIESERFAGTGTIRTVVPYGDSRSHMFEVRIDVPAGDWIIGESTRVQVPTAAAKEVLAVPRDALVLRADGAAVFRVSGENKAERVNVVPGIGAGELIAVDGGVSAGDQIVIRGAERLREGQDVVIKNGGGAPASAAAGS